MIRNLWERPIDFMTHFSWKLGRVAGIDLYLHPTFLLLLAFAYASLGGLMAVLLVAAAFSCVLLHELGHALAARFCGIRTADITLYPIGGVARLERMPRRARSELLITLAGPAVNLLIAAALALLIQAGTSLNPQWPLESIVPSFLSALLSINLILAAFNMIPAFPMDGGRVFRAILTGWFGRLRATEIAVGLGRFLALAFGVYALMNLNILQMALAGFVFLAGSAELARVRQEEWLGDSSSTPRDGAGGVWMAPPGHRWVRVGHGTWRLAPIVVPVDHPSRNEIRWTP